MKNVKNLFGMAVMATALVGCSSNDNLNPNANEGAGKAGTAYAKFTIQLPTTNGTRADKPGTPSFNGGSDNEYAVKDAQLLIFEKTPTSSSEGDYKFVETVKIGNLEPWNNQNSQGVTRYADITAKLDNVDLNDSGDKYYALFILNNEGQTKVTLPTTTPETTYSAWNKANHANSAADFLKSTNGFYMANAPKYVAGDEPTTLVPIKGVYSTKAEAQNKPATTVYVERGMAKVTIGSSTFDANKDVTTSTNYDGDKVTITNWTLDVLNKTTFPVHKTDGLKTILNQTWAGRFFDNTSTEFKRVYWGVDPNYDLGLTDIADCKDQFYLVDPSGATYNGETSSSVTWSTKDQPLYCLENTFDINNMKQGQTTRVLFKATYTPAAVASETDKTFFMIGDNPKIWTMTTLKQQITNKVQELLKSTSVSVTINAGADLLKAGSHKVTAADITITGTTASLNYNELNTKLGLDNTPGIKTYKNGECYYIARIKHFNELTPWASGDPTYKNTTLSEAQSNEKYLGRYGVLRNNWYDLTVSKVSAPGYPDVPVVKPDTADDEDTKYINVEVKILDWAKRSQSVDL